MHVLVTNEPFMGNIFVKGLPLHDSVISVIAVRQLYLSLSFAELRYLVISLETLIYNNFF